MPVTRNGTNGDDYFSATGQDEEFVGYLGTDTVDYQYAPQTNVITSAEIAANLSDPSANTGWAAGDTYTSIENLFGSRYADILTGDQYENVIQGLFGNDTISGGQVTIMWQVTREMT